MVNPSTSCIKFVMTEHHRAKSLRSPSQQTRPKTVCVMVRTILHTRLERGQSGRLQYSSAAITFHIRDYRQLVILYFTVAQTNPESESEVLILCQQQQQQHTASSSQPRVLYLSPLSDPSAGYGSDNNNMEEGMKRSVKVALKTCQSKALTQQI